MLPTTSQRKSNNWPISPISTQRNATYFTLSNSLVRVSILLGLGGALCICIYICICSCICICICIFICICICICVFICTYICIRICIRIPRTFCWYWSLLRVVGSIFRKSSESLLVLDTKVRPSTIQLIVRKQTISWFSSRFVKHFFDLILFREYLAFCFQIWDNFTKKYSSDDDDDDDDDDNDKGSPP